MVLLARDIMDANVLCVDARTDALACARTMTERHKGYAIVLGPSGELAGIVTEWDFLQKVLAAGVDPARTPVATIASPVVQSCTPDTPAEDVVQTMATQGIRRLVVRSEDRVVGIVTSRDILSMFRSYIDKLSAQIASYHSDPATLGN
jgi:CBS domain-containing protein